MKIWVLDMTDMMVKRVHVREDGRIAYNQMNVDMRTAPEEYWMTPETDRDVERQRLAMQHGVII